MKKKKILSLVTLALLGLGVSGCAVFKADAPRGEQQKTEETKKAKKTLLRARPKKNQRNQRAHQKKVPLTRILAN